MTTTAKAQLRRLAFLLALAAIAFAAVTAGAAEWPAEAVPEP